MVSTFALANRLHAVSQLYAALFIARSTPFRSRAPITTRLKLPVADLSPAFFLFLAHLSYRHRPRGTRLRLCSRDLLEVGSSMRFPAQRAGRAERFPANVSLYRPGTKRTYQQKRSENRDQLCHDFLPAMRGFTRRGPR